MLARGMLRRQKHHTPIAKIEIRKPDDPDVRYWSVSGVSDAPVMF